MKKKFKISRRVFNKLVIINLTLILLPTFFQEKKPIKNKIKFNDHIWLLNKND